MARRSKCTPERRKKIIRALEAGNYRHAACRHAGIGESTFYRWMEVGEADAEADKRTIYREFMEGVIRAEAKAETQAVEALRMAMPGDWRAAAHYLERRYPGLWGRKDRHEHTGADGGPVEVSSDLSRLSVEEKRALLVLLEKAGEGDG